MERNDRFAADPTHDPFLEMQRLPVIAVRNSEQVEFLIPPLPYSINVSL